MFKKICHTATDYSHQKAWLKLFEGSHIVKVLSFDDQQHLLNLERILGRTLAARFPKTEAADISCFCQVLTILKERALQRQTDITQMAKPFPHLQDWCNALFQNPDLPQQLLKQAQDVAAELLETSPAEILLHGDLHHDNILLKENKPIIIDPKPVIGDPIFEAARFVINPYKQLAPMPNARTIIENRLQKLDAYFQDHTQRTRRWSFVCAMISACWNLTDGLTPIPWLKIAEQLHSLKMGES